MSEQSKTQAINLTNEELIALLSARMSTDESLKSAVKGMVKTKSDREDKWVNELALLSSWVKDTFLTSPDLFKGEVDTAFLLTAVIDVNNGARTCGYTSISKVEGKAPEGQYFYHPQLPNEKFGTRVQYIHAHGGSDGMMALVNPVPAKVTSKLLVGKYDVTGTTNPDPSIPPVNPPDVTATTDKPAK